MTRLFALSQALLVLLLLLSVKTQAIGITLLIQDQDGKPIPNTVIEIAGSGMQTANIDTPAIVDQVDKRFEPELRIIQVGQFVSFPNSDNIRHHVYSFSTPKPFELKLYANKHEKPLLFDQPGVVVLGCNIHDSMVGFIYVAAEMAVATDQDGRVTLPVDKLPNKIYLWHALQATGYENRQIRTLNKPDDFRFDQQQNTYLLRLELNEKKPRNTFKAKFQTDTQQ